MSGSRPVLKNVLAERYASQRMLEIWSREKKIRVERELWIAVMRAQSKHGLSIASEDIAKYEKVIDQIDLESIDRRERDLRHDVKARIEEFNALAGLQLIHLGMTSRDLTENVELLQIKQSLQLIKSETIAILKMLAEKMDKYSDLVMVGRSHNVPAQLTTLGKRFATTAEELFFAFDRLNSLLERIPLKGLRGPVGTGQDLEDLVGSDGARQIEEEITSSLGFTRTLDSTGQIYPRSIDFEVISTLVQLASAPASLATNIRLISGFGLVSEGFKKGQVGSSAMPHKVNARSSERINGLAIVLKGHLSMISELTGDQWNEGDVSCSVVRRVALPDSFFALDGLFQTLATVLDELAISESAIRSEVERELPFVSTTRILTEAVKRGMGREDAHKAIQAHSLVALERVRSGESHQFEAELGDDRGFPLDEAEIRGLLGDWSSMIGAAEEQVSRLSNRIKSIESEDGYSFEAIR